MSPIENEGINVGSPWVGEGRPVNNPGGGGWVGPNQAVGGGGGRGGGHHPNHHRVRPGLRIRLRRVDGMTPKRVLRQPLYLPAVIGEDFTVEEMPTFEDFGTVGAGEFAQATPGPTLDRLAADTLSMTWSPKWMTHPHQSEKHVKRVLESIARHKAPVHLLAVAKPRARFAEYAGIVTIRAVRRTLRAREADTHYYSLEFAQHRSLKQPRRRNGGPELPATHRLDKDDTLRNLARRYYGSSEQWRRIKRANGIKNVGGAEKLVSLKRYKVGSRILIPGPPDIGRGTVADNLDRVGPAHEVGDPYFIGRVGDNRVVG
jgi:hypothetical protein